METAVVMVAVLTLTFLVLTAGLYFYGRAVVTRAAHHGLEQTRVLNGSPAAGESIASQFLAETDAVTNPQVTASRSGTEATVTVQGSALSLLPGLAPTVSATATGPVERLEP